MKEVEEAYFIAVVDDALFNMLLDRSDVVKPKIVRVVKEDNFLYWAVVSGSKGSGSVPIEKLFACFVSDFSEGVNAILVLNVGEFFAERKS